jgi:hypothetical protein
VKVRQAPSISARMPLVPIGVGLQEAARDQIVKKERVARLAQPRAR